MPYLTSLRRFFLHRTTILILFCFIISSFLLGVFFPQTSIRTAEYYQQLALSQPKFYQFIELLSLKSFSSSFWFLSLIFLFSISLSLTLWQQAKSFFAKTATKTINNERFSHIKEIDTLPLAKTKDFLKKLLKKLGYRLLYVDVTDNKANLIFGKHLIGNAGSLFLHFGLLLLIIAALYGYFFHSRGFVQVMEGETISGNPPDWLEIEHGRFADIIDPDFSFMLEKLEVDYWPDSSKKRIESLFKIKDKDTKEQSIAVSLGAPMMINGISFFQTNHFGYTVTFIIKRPGEPGIPTHFMVNSSKNLKQAPNATNDFPLTDYIFEIYLYPDSEKPSFFLNNPSTSITILKNDEIVFLGQMKPGQKASFDGVDLYCASIKYWTGVTLLKGYALPLVYLSFAFIMIGVFLIYFFIPRKIHIQLRLNNHMVNSVALSGRGKNAAIFIEKELNDIYKELHYASI